MTIINVARDGREYWHWPIVGSTSTPDIQIGVGAWVAMAPATGYVPLVPVTGATWWQVLFAGPNTTSNPTGTVVVPDAGAAGSLIRIRVTDTPEILPVHAGIVCLTD